MTARKVIIRMTVEYPVEVPSDWDIDMIHYHYNDSSWCCSNAIEDLDKLYGDASDGAVCMCGVATFEYVREDCINGEQDLPILQR